MDVYTLIAQEARPFFAAAALRAAEQLGLFAPGILDGAPTVSELARRLEVAPRRLERLLDVLVLDGVLRRKELADGAAHVAGARREAAGQAIAEVGLGAWGRLAEIIRRDTAVDEEVALDALARHHAHLASAGHFAARALASRLAALAPPSEALLDVGGGAGTYSTAWLDCAATARATLVDRAPVLALALAAAQRYPDRLSLVEADARALALPPCFGVALLANLLHLHAPSDAARIVERAAAALAPGGWLVVKDLLVEADRSGPPAGVLFALNMVVFTDGGDVYDPERIAGWLDAAGLVDVHSERLAGVDDAVVVLGRRG